MSLQPPIKYRYIYNKPELLELLHQLSDSELGHAQLLNPS